MKKFKMKKLLYLMLGLLIIGNLSYSEQEDEFSEGVGVETEVVSEDPVSVENPEHTENPKPAEEPEHVEEPESVEESGIERPVLNFVTDKGSFNTSNVTSESSTLGSSIRNDTTTVNEIEDKEVEDEDSEPSSTEESVEEASGGSAESEEKVEEHEDVVEANGVSGEETSEMEEESAKKSEIKDYSNYLNYHDKSINYNFDEGFYINGRLARTFNELKDEDSETLKSFDKAKLHGKLNLGYNYKFDKDLKVGLFGEYDRQILNHVMAGVNVKYKDILGFVRYRAVLGDSHNLVNHNVDAYVKYSHLLKEYDKFRLSIGLGGYLSYQTKAKLTEDLMIKDRVQLFGDLEFKGNYAIDKTSNVYAIPSIKLGLNTRELYNVKTNELEAVYNNDSLVYSLTLGYNKTFKEGLTVKTEIIGRGNESKQFRVKGNFGLSYNW